MGIGVKQSTVGVPSSGVTGGAHAGNGSAGSAGSWLVRKSINEEYTAMKTILSVASCRKQHMCSRLWA